MNDHACEWWSREREGDPATVIADYVKQMMVRQQSRLDRYRAIARAAGLDSVLFKTGVESISPVEGVTGRGRQPTPILSHIVDSLQADIYKNRVIPMAVTDKGNYRQRKRARLLNQFLEGVFEETNYDILQLKMGLYSLYFGDVILKGVCTPKKRVGFEVVPPWEVWVDELESRYGTPRSYFHTYLVDRGVARALAKKTGDSMYGSKAYRVEAVESAPRERDVWISEDAADTMSDMVMIIECWHVPSGPDAGDGRHLVCTKKGTLCDYEFDAELPPLRWLRCQTPLAGMWDLDSVAWRLLPNQSELTYLDRRIREAVATVGLPRIYAQREAKLKVEHLNDWVGAVIVGSGPNPPISLDWTPIHPTVLQHREQVKQEMYEISGGNQLQANGSLPPGIQEASGKALDTFDDIFSARHAVKHRLLESTVVAAADLAIDIATEIAEEEGTYEVQTTSSNWLRKIQWGDIGLDRDEYKLKVMTVSWLSRLPSMKFKQVQELLKAGAIDLEQFKVLWPMPDIDAEEDLDTATFEVVDKTLDTIAFKEVYLSPESFDNLALCISRGRKFYNWLRVQDGVSETALMLVAQFIDEAVALEKQGQPPAPSMGESLPAGGAPLPPGAAPPPGGAPPMPPGPPMPGPGAPPMAA